jgi:two-component system, LytTR family, response regulator
MSKAPVRTVIVDDDPQAISNLRGLLAIYPSIHIEDVIVDDLKASAAILEIRPDLVFLDIQMPNKNGFEIIKELTDASFHPKIIFATGYDKYAVQALRCAAFDYLLKPINPTELHQVIERVMKDTGEAEYENRYKTLVGNTLQQPRLKFNTAGGFILINPKDIIYIQADWNYSEIFLDEDRHEIVSQNIGSLEEMLPKCDFFRISRSIIINTAYLKKVSRTKMTAYLEKDGKEWTFKIPLLNIRKLESFLDN